MDPVAKHHCQLPGTHLRRAPQAQKKVDALVLASCVYSRPSRSLMGLRLKPEVFLGSRKPPLQMET